MEEYGRAEWRRDEAAARAEAEHRIRAVVEAGGDTLDLTDLTALTALPDSLGEASTLRWLFAGSRRPNGEEGEYYGHQLRNLVALSGLTGLTTLDLSGTRVTDLALLSGLTGLTTLDLSGTRVGDLSVLLELPRFREEQGARLKIQRCAAADPKRDLRLSGLSNLSPEECATAVVRYLKGENPEGHAPTLPERLAAASPIALTVIGGRIAATNRGSPERDRPGERAMRLQALHSQLSHLREEAAERQVPRTIQERLARYGIPLADEEPTYLLLDGPMAFIRGGLADSFLTAGLDAGFVEGWRQLCTMHDHLRPLLLPPEEADQPQPAPEATPEEAERIADEAIALIEEWPEIDASVPEALRAGKDYFEIAKRGGASSFSTLRRGLVVVGHVVSSLGNAAKAVTAVSVFLATP